MVKALLALTSYNGKFYDDGANTGVFFVEAYHPWAHLVKEGVEVTFVSETGTFGWDEHSISEAFLQGDDRKVYEDANSDFNKALKDVKKPSEVNAADFDIFFAAGGHGAVFDFPKAKGLHKLAYEIYTQKKVLAAVCHGPLIFENLDDAFGQRLIRGKKITGFTDEGEAQLKLENIFKEQNLHTPREVAELSGATYVDPPSPWESFVVVDGNLVTGVNPASATDTVAKSLEVLAK